MGSLVDTEVATTVLNQKLILNFYFAAWCVRIRMSNGNFRNLYGFMKYFNKSLQAVP